MEQSDLERVLETQVESLGYELVELEQLGSKTRPLLRIRIDRPGSEPGKGVTIDDCARVSRALEQYLDNRGDDGDRYTLEVSSPGIERPLVKRRDFERFAGREIALKLQTPLPTHGKRVEGILRGVEDLEGREHVRLTLPDQDVISIPRDQIVAAKLVFRWDQ
jgi:ribosome maturation factor RimP